jgi:outer membrane lipoprotein-sorting protein
VADVDRRDRHFDDLLDHAAKTLRQAPVPPGPPPEVVARVLQEIPQVDTIPLTIITRIMRMNRIARLAVAATILAVAGSVVGWFTIGGSTSIAFAEVAAALDNVRSATYDATTVTISVNSPRGTQSPTVKHMFLAPSHRRTEIFRRSGEISVIGISDDQRKIQLFPANKLAVVSDYSPRKWTDIPFELARKLVREGSSGAGEKFEPLGNKMIDGCKAVGFRRHSEAGQQDMTVWADPQTARPIQIELEERLPGGRATSRTIMSNFRYDVELDPSLFSTEPPAGYTVQTTIHTMPAENDLIETLRLVAEHNSGNFPALTTNEEFSQAVKAAAKPDDFVVVGMPGSNRLTKIRKPFKGEQFFTTLKPENDSHYAGKDVKLGTPDRPIFWYKPTGAEKYRVIYADLSVKEVSAADLKTFPAATPK